MRILIACGGTAGHIFPAIALLEELKKENENCQIVVVLSTHPQDKEYLKTANFSKGVRIETIGSVPLPYRVSFEYVFFILGLIRASLESFYIILRYKPNVVIGFGGHTSFAPLIIARIIGIPTLIHEQNLIPGRANRLLAKIADKIAVTFDDTNKFFSGLGSGHRIVKTGLPLRKHILAHKDFSAGFTQTKKKFTILVVGGSQGAHNINELVLNCLSRMDKETLAQLHLIHLTGKRDFHYVMERYKALGADFQVFDFLNDLANAYKIADMLISRSGASTIFEAAAFGLPCILIPHSYGTRHQKENALYLERTGSAIILDEETASAQDLEKIVRKLISNKKMRDDLSQRIKMLDNPKASHNLKEQLFSLCRAG